MRKGSKGLRRRGLQHHPASLLSACVCLDLVPWETHLTDMFASNTRCCSKYVYVMRQTIRSCLWKHVNVYAPRQAHVILLPPLYTASTVFHPCYNLISSNHLQAIRLDPSSTSIRSALIKSSRHCLRAPQLTTPVALPFPSFPYPPRSLRLLSLLVPALRVFVVLCRRWF